MLLVDNFRVFVLVGLICAAGITPSQADLKCLKPDKTEDICDATGTALNCLVDQSTDPISGGGCVDDAACGATPPPADGTVACDSGKCCCKAIDTAVCNDLSVETIKTQACTLKDLEDKKPCKPDDPVVKPPVVPGSPSTGNNDTATDPPDSATSLTLSFGLILTMMSFGVFWSQDACRIRS